MRDGPAGGTDVCSISIPADSPSCDDVHGTLPPSRPAQQVTQDANGIVALIRTCGNAASRCPGHFGHIELAESVLHMAFVSDINRLIQATCRTCGRVLLSQQELDAYRARLNSRTDFMPAVVETTAKEVLTKAKKVKLCPHCGKQQFQIEFTKPTIFHEITEEGGATRLLPVAIRERLENGRETAPLFDCAGFTRDLETIYLNLWHDYRQREGRERE